LWRRKRHYDLPAGGAGGRERNKIAVAKAQTDAQIAWRMQGGCGGGEAFGRAGDVMILKAQLDIAKAQARR